MKFRPCIDIHNGKVKQIVGSSLRDEGDCATENYVAEQSAADYAALFSRDGLTGGHVILLNGASSPYYEATAREAEAALSVCPGLLQVGGGITAENAAGIMALLHPDCLDVMTGAEDPHGRKDARKIRSILASY